MAEQGNFLKRLKRKTDRINSRPLQSSQEEDSDGKNQLKQESSSNLSSSTDGVEDCPEYSGQGVNVRR